MGPSRSWELAHRAAGAAGVALAPLISLGDADRLIEVMIATWGEHQLLPREVIRALAESGDVPYGALRDGALVGYVLGWAGVDRGGLHVHSHMLAVVPEVRHEGVGYALKLAQRAQALEQGIHVVRWTFDPMIARNAWFNLGKLGAVADRFYPDFYGRMSDLLNRGERTDRFMVRWDLDREPGPREAVGAEAVAVPADYGELRGRDPAAAHRARERLAGTVAPLFAAGRIALGFDRERSAYLFAPAERGGT